MSPFRIPPGLTAGLLLLAAPGAARAQFTALPGSSSPGGGLPTWGAVVADLDGDGDPDVLNGNHFYQSFVYWNLGDGTFDHLLHPQFATSFRDRHAFTFADLDGDGILDGVCSHGGSGGCGCSDDGNELWKGTGGGGYQLIVGAGGMSDSTGRGRAFSCADVDGDGDVDLYHAKAPLLASPNSLYRNDGGLSFVDVAPALGLDAADGPTAGLFADYDDDGDPDLLTGGDEFRAPTILWRNDGATFTDVTAAAFGALPVVAGADWGDYDGDEDLDLALVEGNEGIWDAWQVDGPDWWCFSHFRNGEDGVDAYTLSTPGENPKVEFRFNGRLYNNLVFLGPNGSNPPPAAFQVTLTDTVVGAPVFTPGVDFGVFCWRDSAGGPWQIRVSGAAGTFGNFSVRFLTVGGISAPADSALESVTLPPHGPRIFRNDGGTFAEVGAGLGLTQTFVNPRQVTWTDFDLDGDLDLHQTNHGTTDTLGEDDVLWRNDGSAFAPLTGPGWVPGDPDYFTDGGTWGDLDGDGDPDLILQEGSGPVFFSATGPTIFYRNDAAPANWIKVTVEPSSLGGTPIGAKATVWLPDRRVHRRVRADSWEGFQRPLALWFGLGGDAVFDSLVVEWQDGSRSVTPGVGVVGAGVVVESGGAAAGAGFAGLPYPQPSLGTQRLALDVPAPGRVRVTVHDVAGRRVRALTDGVELLPGRRLLTWDGRDDRGRVVPPGVYFFRGEGDLSFVRKSVRLR